MKSAVRICIEGNIGCGKSSVLKALQELQTSTPEWQTVTIIPEPILDWHHLLEPLYAAPPHTTAQHSLAALLQVAVLNAYALRVPTLRTDRLKIRFPGQGRKPGWVVSRQVTRESGNLGRLTAKIDPGNQKLPSGSCDFQLVT
jgi:hypothetical protein